MADSLAETTDTFVRDNLKRNVTAQVAHGAFSQVGFRIINAPTFIPDLLFALSGSEIVVGIARSLQALGQTAAPFIGAALVGHRPLILSTTFTYGMLMRVQLLVLAAVIFWMSGSAAAWAVCAVLASYGFVSGIQTVTVNSLRAKVIPAHRRGITMGLRNITGGFVTASVAYLAGIYLVADNTMSTGYSALFTICFLLSAGGMCFLLLTREPRTTALAPKRTALKSLQAVPQLIRRHPQFATYALARALGTSGRIAVPFYILFATTQVDLSGAELGLLTSIWVLSGTTSNLFWGIAADRTGHRIIMVLGIALWAVSQAALPLLDSFYEFAGFFAVVGLASGGFMLAAQNLVLELGDDADRPLMIATANSTSNLVVTVGPLVGGLVVVSIGYAPLFIATSIVQIAAVAILVMRVREPRHTR